MIASITPLVLTFNEAANIGRTLDRLTWAREVVVLDSFSDDETLEIVSAFPNTKVVQRKFDNHAAQANFGLSETGIATDWVLALDADFVLTPEFVDELSALDHSAQTAGYRAQLVYCVEGRELRSSVLPQLTVLFRRSRAQFVQDGHAHRVRVAGPIETLRANILHDDRKPLSRWFDAQRRYMQLEAKKLKRSNQELSLADHIRRLRVVAPWAVAFYCLIVRGGILDGWAGCYYAFQRMAAELMLSLYLIEDDLHLERGAKPAPASEVTMADVEKPAG
jgi:glycosyltransferase involved in cell wall biosynthesis